MKLILRYCICCVLLLSSFGLYAQVDFVISVHTKEIGRKDQLQVNYDISGATDQPKFIPPHFGSDWEIVSGPQYGYQKNIQNGVQSSVISYIYILSPRRSGKLKLPSTSIKIKGKDHRCKEIMINVKKQDHSDVPLNNAVAQGRTSIEEDQRGGYEEEFLKPGEDAVKKIRRNLFVKAIASKTRCYVGEPVLVTYKLYTRLRSRSSVVKQPSFTGCTVSEMTTNENQFGGKEEMLDGRKYSSYIIRKVQLFPLQPGRMTVGIASVENTVTFLSTSSQFKDLYYGQRTGEKFDITLSTEPFFIEVLPLPEKKMSSAIGDFKLSTKLKKPTIASNESNALIVSVEGQGNFTSVTEPEINWPANIYRFDTKESDSIDRLAFPLKGKKVYEIPFEVDGEGKVDLPAISFTYFDPSKGKYQTTTSQPLQLKVTPAIKANLQQSVVAGESGLFDIRYLFYILPVVFFLGVLIILKRSKKRTPTIVTVAKQTAPEVPAVELNVYERLDELVLVQDDTAFYSQAARFARELMQHERGNNELLLQVLQDCNSVLYTPIASTSKKEVLDKLREAIA